MRTGLLLAAAAVCCWVRLASDLDGKGAPASRPAGRADVTPTPTAPPEASARKPARDEKFASTVRPILLKHCAPCHEPGGVMYERLPFDHAEVIASHSAGVLKRIKAPDERAAIERWLASEPPSSGQGGGAASLPEGTDR